MEEYLTKLLISTPESWCITLDEMCNYIDNNKGNKEKFNDAFWINFANAITNYHFYEKSFLKTEHKNNNPLKCNGCNEYIKYFKYDK